MSERLREPSVLALGSIKVHAAFVTHKCAIADHPWKTGNSPDWEGVKILDPASRKKQYLVKEAICIQLTPSEQLLNRDSGWQIATRSGCD